MPADTLAASLIALLRRKRLLRAAPKVLRALHTLRAKQDRRIEVTATVARTLSPRATQLVEAKAQELFGDDQSSVTVTFHTDALLFGGVRLATQDAQYDFSLGRTLHELRTQL